MLYYSTISGDLFDSETSERFRPVSMMEYDEETTQETLAERYEEAWLDDNNGISSLSLWIDYNYDLLCDLAFNKYYPRVRIPNRYFRDIDLPRENVYCYIKLDYPVTNLEDWKH